MGHLSYLDKNISNLMLGFSQYINAVERFKNARDNPEDRSCYSDGRPKSEWSISLEELRIVESQILNSILFIVQENLEARIVLQKSGC